MTKEHKKLYKAGKNWIVATLTATTITLLGGIGAYTVHADTTIESSQDVQTTSVNQTNQVDNSNDSVTINQPVAVQSSQTAQNDLSVQGNQTNQTVPSSATAAADTSNSDSLDSNIYGTVQSSQNNNSNNSVVLNQPVTTQSNSTVKNSQPVQNTPTTLTVTAATNNSSELDPNIYGTVNVKDWDYQNDSDTFNLTGYHGQDTRHIIVPNLNDFNNAGVKIGNAAGVGISSVLTKNLASRRIAFAISKTSGKYSDKVIATDNNWSNVFSYTDLINADVSNLDTRSITNMGFLFYDNPGLKTVGNLSHWNVSNVTNMCSMFAGYHGVISGLSHWNVSNVRDMSGMFKDCKGVIGDLSHWDTSNVTDMGGMFYECKGVIGDLSHWDTSNVTDMGGMFAGYSGTIGDLSHWDTSNVTDMGGMFAGYSGTIGDLSHWDTSNVTDMREMFYISSTSVSGLTHWNTKNVMDMARMFDGSSLPYKIVASDAFASAVIPNQVTLKDSTGKILALIDTPTIYNSHKSVRSTIDGIVQAEVTKLNNLNHTSYGTPKIISDGDDDYSIANATYVVNTESQSKTGLINYVDQDGKVIKTDTISGKVGDKVDVKISLPDGYELANKDEHIPSVITVTENGIGTINVNVKKINTTLANNEVPYDSTTISNNVNSNYGNLDGYSLTENDQGQAQLIASGWHATGVSNSDRYRYMIVFDNTLGHEIARQKLVPQIRSDVQRAYPNINNSLYSGFNVTIDIPNSSINHSLSLIARYSNDPNNGEGARVDYRFNPLALNEGNQAYLDGLSSNGDTLSVTGWHATNQAAGRPYHYIIAWDQNLGHEIARQKVTAVSRPDVANAYSTVANAVNSGFNVSFNLTPQFFNDNIQFISRWTDDAAGNGNAVDYWFKPMNRTNRANLDSVTLSNGQVKVAGWHATDLSQLEPNHYLIVFDNTTGQQVASEKVDLQSSQDVKNVFGDIQTANHSRFNYTFDSLHLIPGHNYSLVSRYSADATGNGNDGAHTDSWLNMGTFQQSAYSIDNVVQNNRHLTVQGWLANDYAMTKPYAYAILIQNGQEIGRQRLNLSERDDVAKAYPQIYRSQYSGFSAGFDLPTFSTKGLQLVLRFTDDPVGNGNSSDTWINL